MKGREDGEDALDEADEADEADDGVEPELSALETG